MNPPNINGHNSVNKLRTIINTLTTFNPIPIVALSRDSLTNILTRAGLVCLVDRIARITVIEDIAPVIQNITAHLQSKITTIETLWTSYTIDYNSAFRDVAALEMKVVSDVNILVPQLTLNPTIIDNITETNRLFREKRNQLINQHNDFYESVLLKINNCVKTLVGDNGILN
jgi:hypothetical protein